MPDNVNLASPIDAELASRQAIQFSTRFFEFSVAQEEKLLIHRGKGRTYAIVPIEEIEEEPYNPEFVAKIMRSKKDFEEGRFTAIKTEDLWK
jgi:hypothetical protein